MPEPASAARPVPSGPTDQSAVGRRVGVALLVGCVLAVALQCYGLYRTQPPPQPGWLPHADKVGHLFGFAVPVLLVTVTIAWYGGGLRRWMQTLVLIVFGVQAAVSELVQGHDALIGRSGDVVDLAADALGIALGYFTVRPLYNWLERRFRPGRAGPG